jgi:hypothetical protein
VPVLGVLLHLPPLLQERQALVLVEEPLRLVLGVARQQDPREGQWAWRSAPL